MNGTIKWLYESMFGVYGGIKLKSGPCYYVGCTGKTIYPDDAYGAPGEFLFKYGIW